MNSTAVAFLAIQPSRDHLAIQAKDGGQVTVCDAQGLHRAVNWIRSPRAKIAADLLVGADAIKALRIIGDLDAVLTLNGKPIVLPVNAGDLGIAASQ